MMSDVVRQDRVCVTLSPEIENHLIANSIDLVAYLQGNKRLPVWACNIPQPSIGNEQGRDKDLSTVILAAGISIATIVFAVKELIEGLSRRPVLVKNRILVPTETRSGEILTGPNGEPILQWKDIAEFIEPDELYSRERLRAITESCG